MPLSIAAVKKLTQPTQSSSLLLIKIVSSIKDSTFTLPVSLVTQRELEMQAASLKFGIPPERWSGSLLYKAYQEQGRTEVVLVPEKECADQNYSHCFKWEPWLTDLVQSYYQTGQLVVPDACQGLDLLLLLEYFGIIYLPNQLAFDSPAAYQRVKVWSDYLTVRSGIADWVAVAITSVQQTHYFFATTPVLDQWAELGQEHLTHLDGGLSVPANMTSCGVIFELFNQTEPEGAAALMREDFSVYLQNILSNVNVSFPVNPLTVHFDELSMEQKKRAVLMIHVINANEPTAVEKAVRTRSELSFPVDEFVEDDLAEGRLESLMEQIDARNPAYRGRSSAYTAQFLTMFESTTAPVSPPRLKHPEKPPRPKQIGTPPKAPGAQPKPVATSQSKTQPLVQTQPKSPVKSQKRQESPRKVTAIDHIYQDLDNEYENPGDVELAIETSYHTVPENKGKKVDSIMPVEIYGNSTESKNTQVQPETTLLITEPVYSEVAPSAKSPRKSNTKQAQSEETTMLIVEPVYSEVSPPGAIPGIEPLIESVSEKSKYVAPVTSVVHSERNEMYSVTSALTNPNFDDDNSLRELLEGEGDIGDIKGQALRQEWIQTSVMNHDVFERAQQLLKEESQRFDREQKGEDHQQKTFDDTFDIWDYVMDACQVLAPAKQDLCLFASPKSNKKGLSPTRSIRAALPQLEDGVCSPFVPRENDFQPDEKNIAKPVPEERPNMSAANYRGLVKERMVQFQQHCDGVEKTKESSLSLKQFSLKLDEGIEVEKPPSQPSTPTRLSPSQPGTPTRLPPSQPDTPTRLPPSQPSTPTRSTSQLLSHPSVSYQKPSPPGTPPKKITSPDKPFTPKKTATTPKVTVTPKKWLSPQKKAAPLKAASPASKSLKASKKSQESNADTSTESPDNSSINGISGPGPSHSPTQSSGNNSNIKITKMPDAEKRGFKGLFRRRKSLGL
jgi:hypothetical protein